MRKMMNRLETGKDITHMADKSRFWVLASYLAIIGFLILNSFQLTKDGAPIYVIALLAFMPILPLLLFAPGLWIRRPRSHAWLCFVSLLYFMYGVDQAFLPGRQLVGLGLSVSSLILFIAAMMFSRWESLRLKPETPAEPQQASEQTEKNDDKT